MLYWMCEKSECDPTSRQLEHVIRRNFGGMKEFSTYDIFSKKIPSLRVPTEESHIPEKVIDY